MFEQLELINTRPKPFEFYTAEDLWADEYTSQQMLKYHLNESIDVSSRNIKFINHSVQWIQTKFGLDASKSICDFGCGPGLYTVRLAETGAQVTGIDFSKRSIEYAKKTATEKSLKIEYVHQNYLKYTSDKKYDLITMIMCDFCALSPQQREHLLRKFHQLLKPNGTILLDVYTLESFAQREEQAVYEINLLNKFWSAEDYFGFLNTFKYNEEHVILDKYTIVEKNRMRIIYNWLQYFNQDSLIAEFESNQFKVTDIFADVAGSMLDSGGLEMAVIAGKIT